jgi:hypothetical protein
MVRPPFNDQDIVTNPLQQQHPDEYEEDYKGINLHIQADDALDQHHNRHLTSALSRHHMSECVQADKSPAQLVQPSSAAAESPNVNLSPQQAAATQGRQFGTMDVFADMQEWPIPSLEQAQVFASQMHPRDKNQDGELVKFSWWSTSLGRHCTQGGCGEQCDGCGEGSESAFAGFGAGMSNYFKFLKWLIWVFWLLLLVSALPLTINTWGSGAQQFSGNAHLASIQLICSLCSGVLH